VIPHRFPNKRDVMGIHFFWSSVLHLIMLTLLLTLPIYSGGIHSRSRSFWEIFVDLRGEGKSAEKAVSPQKSPSTAFRPARRKDTNEIAIPKTPKAEEKKSVQKDSVDKAVPPEAKKDKEPEREKPVEEAPSILEPPAVNPPASSSPAPAAEQRIIELEDKPAQMVEEKTEDKTPLKEERREEKVAANVKEVESPKSSPVAESPNPPLILKESPKEETGLARPPEPASSGKTLKESALASKIVSESHANEAQQSSPLEQKPIETPEVKSADNPASSGPAPTAPLSPSQAETAGKTASPSTKADADNGGDGIKASGNDNKKAEVMPPIQKMAANEKKEPAIGIPLAEALLWMNIKIEVISGSAEMPDVATQVFKRSHPMDRVRKGEKQKEVDVVQKTEEGDKTEKTRSKKIFSVAKADKGIYTVIMRNKGEKADGADIIFTLYEKGKKERIKKYRAVTLSPEAAVKFKFLLPEGVFWDDGDRFSGSIEDSDSVTKFNSETGLTWKEEKED